MGHKLIGGGKLPEPKDVKGGDPRVKRGVFDLNTEEEECSRPRQVLGSELGKNRMVILVFKYEEWLQLLKRCPGVPGHRPASAVVRWGVSRMVGTRAQPFNLAPRADMAPVVPNHRENVRVCVRVTEYALQLLQKMEGGHYGCKGPNSLVRWAILRGPLAMSPQEIRERIELRGRPKPLSGKATKTAKRPKRKTPGN